MRVLVRQLITQLETFAASVAQLEEQYGCSSRNSLKPPHSDGSDFKPTGKGQGRVKVRHKAAGGGHTGAGFAGTALVPWPGLLPVLI